jgi:prepilin-type N-terminal cleavage/methylation domain-containing protein
MTDFGHDRAFTLTELLVALVLALLVAAAGYYLMRGQAGRIRSTMDDSTGLSQLHRLQTMMGDDIANAGYDPSTATLVPVQSGTAQSLVLQSDPAQGAESCSPWPCPPSGTVETITYYFDPVLQTLVRNKDLVANQLESFSLTYETFDPTVDRWIQLPLDPVTGLSPHNAPKVERIRVEWRSAATSEETQRKQKGKPYSFTAFLQNSRSGTPVPTPVPTATPGH